MAELKPCPFCGEPAELKKITGRWTAKCTKECAGTRIFKDQQKAIEVWNRRVETTQEETIKGIARFVAKTDWNRRADNG